MKVLVDLNVAPKPGECAFDVRDRVADILRGAGLSFDRIGVEAADPKKPIIPAGVPKRNCVRRVYSSPLYPGTDEFHEFYFEKALT